MNRLLFFYSMPHKEQQGLMQNPELPDNRSRTRVIKVKDRMFC